MRHKPKGLYLVIGVLVAFIIFEAASYLQFNLNIVNPFDKSAPAPKLEQLADQVVKACSDASYHPSCYDKEIPNLMHNISMEDAFKVTAMVQAKDNSYPYCHVLAHELSAREVDKNPNNWKDVVVRCPSGMCSNGCLHGAFQEEFRTETLTDEQLVNVKPELMDICEKRSNWSPTGLEQASCYHALGHLTMYVTNADVPKSITLCNELAIKPGRDFSHLCDDGVFMQIFQPLEPDDFALIKGKEVSKEQFPAFCNKFSGQEKGSCWSEGWPLFRAELEKPQGLTSYCGKADASERDRCFEAISYVMTAIFNLDGTKITPYCAGLESKRQGNCFASAASRMIEVDYKNIGKASALCSSAEKYDPQHDCFNRLLQYSTYNYQPSSQEFYNACNSLPDSWKDKCLKQAKA